MIKRLLAVFLVVIIGLIAVDVALASTADASSILDFIQYRGCPRNFSYLQTAIDNHCGGRGGG